MAIVSPLPKVATVSRSAREVVPGLPHHVTQRGNRRQPVFFNDGDYRLYRYLLAQHCTHSGVNVWAYAFLPNHVHLLLAPRTAGALTAALREAHRRFTTAINRREGWTGYLWQGRYGSQPLKTDAELLAVTRYIELNPVEAGLVKRPQDWPWSSARSHLGWVADPLLTSAELIEIVGDWETFLAS